MQKKHPVLIVAVLGLLTLTATAKPVTMSLQIRSGELRSSPSFLGSIVGTAQYGDRFTVKETQGAWKHVQSEDGPLTGWLHSSALTTKKVTLKAGEKDAEVTASSGELALAGKGFNSEVEAMFKEQNRQANFKAVDLMEKIGISTKEIQQFLTAGQLAPKGGAQ